MNDSFNEEIQKLKSHPGEIIGSGMIEDRKFILGKEGPEGLARINAELAAAGCLTYDNIKHGDWYPLSCNFTAFVLAKKLFGWDDETMRELGRQTTKISLLMRTMTKHFVSPRKVFESAPFYWKKFYTIGEMETLEFSEEEKFAVFRVKDFPGHYLFCRLMEGIIEQVASFARGEGIKCLEIKCRLKGEDEGHVFKLTWEKR